MFGFRIYPQDVRPSEVRRAIAILKTKNMIYGPQEASFRFCHPMPLEICSYTGRLIAAVVSGQFNSAVHEITFQKVAL